jgi:hypothetical protein
MKVIAGQTVGWQYKKAYLNGELVVHAFEADEEAGYVKHYKTKPDGVFLEHDSEGNVVVETLYGIVQIR